MKFRWKLMIITMLIVSFSFGFGGMLLIQYSYQASIKQEKRAARNSYEMISLYIFIKIAQESLDLSAFRILFKLIS